MHSYNFNIAVLDRSRAADLQHKIDQKTKPVGSLGRLETLALQLGLIQDSLTPHINAPHILVCAGDHGSAKAGVSAYPQDVTWQMVENFLAGGAAINVLARQVGAQLVVVDAGVAHDFGARPNLIDAKVASGTASYLSGAAMTTEQRFLAGGQGAAIVRDIAATGCNVLCFGEMGIGNTASASLITHCLTGVPLADCVGRGTGLDDAGLIRKQTLLAEALTLFRTAHPPSPAPRAGATSHLPLTEGEDGRGSAKGAEVGEHSKREALEVLAYFGGFEIAMLTGAMLAAAERGMTLLIDGFIVTAALLVAHKLAPEILDYCVFAHRSGEPGHSIQLSYLHAEPLLDLGMRLGEGTGAALALPILGAACAFMNEMASFESAGVSGKP